MSQIAIFSFSWINPFGDRVPSQLLFHGQPFRGAHRDYRVVTRAASEQVSNQELFPTEPLGLTALWPGGLGLVWNPASDFVFWSSLDFVQKLFRGFLLLLLKGLACLFVHLWTRLTLWPNSPKVPGCFSELHLLSDRFHLERGCFPRNWGSALIWFCLEPDCSNASCVSSVFDLDLLRSGCSTTGFLPLAWPLPPTPWSKGVLQWDWPVSNLQVAGAIRAVWGPWASKKSLKKWDLHYLNISRLFRL